MDSLVHASSSAGQFLHTGNFISYTALCGKTFSTQPLGSYRKATWGLRGPHSPEKKERTVSDAGFQFSAAPNDDAGDDAMMMSCLCFNIVLVSLDLEWS